MLVPAMAHACIAAPPGDWGSPTIGDANRKPTLVVDSEFDCGTVDVLSWTNGDAVGGIGGPVTVWATDVTGPWGASASTQCVEDPAGSVTLHMEILRSTVALQFPMADGTPGYAWGIRCCSTVRIKSSTGNSTHQQARVVLMATTATLADAVAASQRAAAFFSALPAMDQWPSPAAAPPATAGTWANYSACMSACFGAAHPAAFQNYIDCMEALGISATMLTGACFLGCLGVPPCVGACLAGLASGGLTIAGGCLAGYLASCGVISAQCAWTCW
ncbi:MAG: hypothetical protein RLZZ303_976 [Candidatus Hydrogenedentota bacterium]